GTDDFNILQNNGKLAHQAVGHVHFHIIPKTDNAGLGIDWPAGQLEPEQATDLLAKIKATL
ncbi:MAG: HIT family protein, partial [Phycisphaeraceae bacterium JB051]